MKRKKIAMIVTMVITVIISSLNISLAYNEQLIEPKVKKCTPYTSYSDYIDTTYKKQQFSHIVEKSSIPQTITKVVTLTRSLNVSGGITGETKILLAKSKVNFELGYEGTKSETVYIQWGPIVNQRARLIAGKVFAKTIGEKSTMDSYCNLTKDYYYIEGSYDTYSESQDI